MLRKSKSKGSKSKKDSVVDAMTEEDDGPIIDDEPGQEALKPPVRYMATAPGELRQASDMSSEVIGQINSGDIVLVTHSKPLAAPPGAPDTVRVVVRVRCERGSAIGKVGRAAGWASVGRSNDSWPTLATDDCQILLVPEEAAADVEYFTMTKIASVYESASTESSTKTKLPQGGTYECLEKDSVGAPMWIRVKAGWIKAKSPKGDLIIKRVVFADKKGDKELAKDKERREKEKIQQAIAAKKHTLGAKGKEAVARSTLEQFPQQLRQLITDAEKAEQLEHYPLNPQVQVELAAALALVEAQLAELPETEEQLRQQHAQSAAALNQLRQYEVQLSKLLGVYKKLPPQESQMLSCCSSNYFCDCRGANLVLLLLHVWLACRTRGLASALYMYACE